MPDSVRGKAVVITGGARGIGRATAKAFLEAGAKVAVGDVDAVLAQRTGAELGCPGLPLDVTDAASFAAFLDDAAAALGSLDVLVNNAGIMPMGQFAAEKPVMTDRQIDINIRGVLTGCRLAAERFLPSGRGHIVNIASLAGVTGEAGLATYCGTKHFVVGFTESLHRELRPRGVRVTAVLPGVINTELSSGAKVPGWASRIVCAEPEAVAAGIVAAVAAGRARVTVPRALGTVLKSVALLPDRARFAAAHALGLDEMASGADTAVRADYERRIAGGPA